MKKRAKDERIAELEMMFLSLVGTIEDLKDRNAELGRRLAALEFDRAVGVTP